MPRVTFDECDDGPDDWVGADNMTAYWAAWARLHDGRLAIPDDEQDGDEPA